jgi:flagellar capping protein FliD
MRLGQKPTVQLPQTMQQALTDIGGKGAWFNLSTGTIGTQISGYSASIENAGGGYYRCSVKFNQSVASNYYTIILADANNSFSVTKNGTDGILIWGASVTQSSSVQPYIPTLATAQTSPVLLPQGLTANKDITGVNAFESARNPYALNLDGASWAEVHDNASLDITSAITLEAWVYWDSTEAAKGIVGKWNSASTQCYLIYVESSSRAQFYTSTTGSNAQSVEHTIPSDGWVHIVGTDDGTNQKLYINGAEEATRASLWFIFAK